MRILALGAGVQSSTLALMCECGEIEKPEVSIFSDTGWEPDEVYTWLDWLEKQLSFKVVRVSKGNIREDLLNMRQSRFASIPYYTRGKSGDGIVMRQCTNEYKIAPMKKEIRKQLGYKKGERIPLGQVDLIMGISLDEVYRMKVSRDKWIKNIYPLVDMRITRVDCIKWMKNKYGVVPPRSSCLGCPFHSNNEWRKIKGNPKYWADVCEMDKFIRKPAKKMFSEQFMHHDRVPLDEVDLSTPEERGQTNMFQNECEGMCGI